MAISYNVAVTLFGGFAPLLRTPLITWTGSSLAPGYYLMAMSLLSGAALLFSQKHIR